MKRFIIAASLGVVVAGFAVGSRAEGPDGSEAGKTPAKNIIVIYNPATDFDQFGRDLSLSKDQQESIKPILDDLEKQLLPLQGLTLQRKGQRGAPIVQEHYQQIRGFLDPEQLQLFEEMIAKGRITSFRR